MPARVIGRSLVFRVALLLSVALLPVGIIALMQTANVSRQGEALKRSALYGQTVADVEPLRDMVYGGFASARVLAASVVTTRQDPDACHQTMQEFTDRSVTYTLATFVQPNNVTTCNSRGETFELGGSTFSEQMHRDRVPSAQVLDRGRISGIPVLIIGYPVYDDAGYLGFVSVSIARAQIDSNRTVTHNPVQGTADISPVPIDLLTFTRDGNIIFSGLAVPKLGPELPLDIDLEQLPLSGDTAFASVSRGGKNRIYTVVTVVPDLVYAVAIWRNTEPGNVLLGAAFFPMLMWAISLAVAYIAVHRLVLVHIRRLRGRMIRFAAGDRDLAEGGSIPRTAPAELRQMDETFMTMAETIIHDEAEQENNLREKNLLLREVHHRVKNNLQLIASIMNMELRKSRAPEARATLQRVLDRVLGLATVHSSLYKTSRLTTVHADALLSTILRQTLSTALPKDAGVTPELDIASLQIAPDQAVPVALLTTEAVTNATKHMGHPDGPGTAWLKVVMEELEPKETTPDAADKKPRARLVISNSKGAPLTRNYEPPGKNGLGSQLIRAFAAQLGGRLEVEDEEDSFCLSLTFAIEPGPLDGPGVEHAPGEAAPTPADAEQ